MGADTVGQSMMDRRDRDVGLQDTETALDVGETLVARNGLGGREVEGVGTAPASSRVPPRRGAFVHAP